MTVFDRYSLNAIYAVNAISVLGSRVKLNRTEVIGLLNMNPFGSLSEERIASLRLRRSTLTRSPCPCNKRSRWRCPVPALIHLVYTSVAAREFTKEELTELLQQARSANERLGVSGMLLFSGGSFFQVLEGSPPVVDELYQKISLDQRHTMLATIVREAVAKRFFGHWSMGFSDVSESDLARIVGLNDFFSGGSCLGDLDVGRAKKLLDAFAHGRWRAKLNPSVPRSLEA